ncbi:FecR family protein [Mucilaginibacter aquariorum]|uniref:FecR domain-containing protein n=1 Tax=Mucilaginibacter aquariorum TaxID=2967225 RepID=A0ABT1T999_9SPHI|nr:FecR domain-containing protein [Mucilaginibacter aquariorum]MCQ6961186.1 FecR domain-containing protein [Mucilaginibacter aquariorum]
MTQQDFIDLYEKFMSGDCTPEEVAFLEEYRDNFQLKNLPWDAEMGDKQEVKRAILHNLNEKIQNRAAKKFREYWIAAAASVVFAIGFLWMFEQKSHPKFDKLAKTTQSSGRPVLPGFNKATLTLADGSNIDLNAARSGLLSKQGGVLVDKAGNGKLVYDANSANGDKGVALNNILTTPRGGQYQLVLSDGTKVWLNAASSLKFPAIFTGKERNVELVGEAYFEVAKNKNMPFRVSTGKLNIEVLGTHFNVSAYQDDDAIKTTLLEGSVKLTTANNKALLKPGEQATLGQQQHINIQSINTDDAVAWKNGYFVFNNENIQCIMKKISRWYDVEVVYYGKVDENDFGGTVSRFDSVNEVLKSLELTGTVHFKLDGRRITVMP